MAKKRHPHHGGAWKVAYADFVTAMMALFLVLWLTSQDQKIKEAVQRSFRNPFASLTKESTGIIPNKDTLAVKAREGNFDSASAVELNMLRKMADDLMKTLQSNPETPDENPLKLEMTPDGMRISVFDRNRKPIFEPDTAEFTSYGVWIFSTLAWEIARYTNSFSIELEGHTELGRPFRSADYTSWELSADRANSARRKLLAHDVVPSQIRKVAGYGETLPMANLDPHDESNRRVGVLLKLNSGSRL
ncbi:MAG: flagellar motor protein MotB [Verrucomicrobiota bacterium]|nr:OmpA family protein [Verrucomicrobiota bacterium]MCC6820443.1 OmpA family protein [Limisphaerales bacterium]